LERDVSEVGASLDDQKAVFSSKIKHLDAVEGIGENQERSSKRSA
jgi:hypothetical protein